jgi:hypothetical protein
MPAEEPPYIVTKKRVVIVEERKYNPKYGDERICKCGHTYERHFDTYEEMANVGCKYCDCGHRGYHKNDVGFVELKAGETPQEVERW